MTVELDKKALISLVVGQPPHYSIFEYDIIKKCGSYSDNRGWTWMTIHLEELSEEDLFDLYELCRYSWK
jgi:hypothetical protein